MGTRRHTQRPGPGERDGFPSYSCSDIRLDAAVVNISCIEQIYFKQEQKLNSIASQTEYCEKLYKTLFDFVSLALQADLPFSRLDSQLNHQQI